MLPNAVAEGDLALTLPLVGPAHTDSSRRWRFRVTRIGGTFAATVGLKGGMLMTKPPPASQTATTEVFSIEPPGASRFLAQGCRKDWG